MLHISYLIIHNDVFVMNTPPKFNIDSKTDQLENVFRHFGYVYRFSGW